MSINAQKIDKKNHIQSVNNLLSNDNDFNDTSTNFQDITHSI